MPDDSPGRFGGLDGSDGRYGHRVGEPRPDVTVVIPTYNRAAFVGEAIASALQQASELSVEVLVADDGSTDRTVEALQQFEDRIRVLSLERNQGRNHARNLGLGEANGEWVKFLDSDDVLEPGSLREEVEVGRASGADIVATSWRSAPRGRALAELREVPGFNRGIDSILAGEAVPTSAALYRRRFVADVAWDTTLQKLDDWDYFVRAFLKGARIVRLPRVSYTWVAHAGQGIRKSSLFENAREHYVILGKVESHLRQTGKLTVERRQRLADYYYKELRVLALHDRLAFDRAVRHIRKLDPHFLPRDEERQWWMRALARVVGFRSACLLYTALKKRLRREGAGPSPV